jgi:hypothetical protein
LLECLELVSQPVLGALAPVEAQQQEVLLVPLVGVRRQEAPPVGVQLALVLAEVQVQAQQPQLVVPEQVVVLGVELLPVPEQEVVLLPVR